MLVDTDHFVSMTLANQNFSRVAHIVEQKGYAIILKNNQARFLLVSFKEAESMQTDTESDLADISKKMAKQYREAHKELFE
jgi:antitoxin Phd